MTEQAINNYNSLKLFEELKAAGLPVVGCSSTGRVDLETKATKAQIDQITAIKAAHDPRYIEEERAIRYQEAGITANAMLEALWQKIVLGDSKGADALQAIRSQIDADLDQYFSTVL